jgi:hypothetical protein
MYVTSDEYHENPNIIHEKFKWRKKKFFFIISFHLIFHKV